MGHVLSCPLSRHSAGKVAPAAQDSLSPELEAIHSVGRDWHSHGDFLIHPWGLPGSPATTWSRMLHAQTKEKNNFFQHCQSSWRCHLQISPSVFTLLGKKAELCFVMLHQSVGSLVLVGHCYLLTLEWQS